MSHDHHDSHGHHKEAGPKMVIFSLFLFFVITVAGHYVFVANAHHGTSGEAAKILKEHAAGKREKSQSQQRERH